MAKNARVTLKDEGKAKVKRKATVEDVEALTRRTRTRIRTTSRTGPGETPTLHQGGPILSPLVGSETRRLRPVPRPNPDKNKELSLPTKMGTSVTPANVPASCGWRKNCARRGLMLPVPPSADRNALGDLQTWCSEYVSVLGDTNTWGYWILGLLYQFWPRKLYLLGTCGTSCLPQPFAWGMAMWCTVVGTAGSTCLWDQGALSIGSV